MRIDGAAGESVEAALDVDGVLGDTVMVFFKPIAPSDPLGPRITWLIAIEATTRDNVSVRVGDVQVPHFGVASGLIYRAVAGAYCPGANRWRATFHAYVSGNLSAESPRPAMLIDAHIMPSRTSSESSDRAWAWSLSADGADDPTAPEDYPTPVNTDGFVADSGLYGATALVPQPMWLARGWGSLEASGGGARRWLMLFDSSLIPADGAHSMDTIGVGPLVAPTESPTWKRRWNQRMYKGFCLVPSSTPDVLTRDGTARIVTTIRQHQRRNTP